MILSLTLITIAFGVPMAAVGALLGLSPGNYLALACVPAAVAFAGAVIETGADWLARGGE